MPSLWSQSDYSSKEGPHAHESNMQVIFWTLAIQCINISLFPRYLKKDKLIHPPPLMEGEAIASRVLELGPAGAKFLGPVIIEVPHFASLRGKEREIVILRSDNGESWREHTLEATEEAVQDVLQDSFDEGGKCTSPRLKMRALQIFCYFRNNSTGRPEHKSNYPNTNHRFPTIFRNYLSNQARGSCNWTRRRCCQFNSCTSSPSCVSSRRPDQKN